MTIYMQSAVRPLEAAPMTEARARRARRACRVLPHLRHAGLGRDDLQPHHAARAGPGGSLPHQSVRPALQRDHRLQPRCSSTSKAIRLREPKWPVNRAGFVIHSAIHGAIAEAHCVMHTHTTTGMAVACLKDGLSPHNFYGAMLHGRSPTTTSRASPSRRARSERLVREHRRQARR